MPGSASEGGGWLADNKKALALGAAAIAGAALWYGFQRKKKSANKVARVPTADKPRAVVVVDPYSSGRYYLYECKERGIPVICVRSDTNMSPYFVNSYTTHLQYYTATLDFPDVAPVGAVQGSEEHLAHFIAALEALPFTLVAIIAGSEPGVELADRLSVAMKMPTQNPLELSLARRDKAAMQDRLRECGVPAAEQIMSSDTETLVKWANERGQWPLVAKPTASCGSDGIFFCHSEEDLRRACEDTLGKVAANGKVQGYIVLQEFLDGIEYIVDTVSKDGKHLVVAMWEYKKRRGVPWAPTCILPEHNYLMEASGPEQDILVDYIFKVLDAVGLQNGPCHSEVMMTKRGPVLVEVNCRMHGLQGPLLIEQSTGRSKTAYSLDVYTEGGKLFDSLYQGPTVEGRFKYTIQQQCKQLVLISPVEGYLKNDLKETITKLGLKNMIEMLPAFNKGEYLEQTGDLMSAPGFVLFVGPTMEGIDQDIERLRKIEHGGKGGLYQVQDDPVEVGSPKRRVREPSIQFRSREPSMMESTTPSLHSMQALERTIENLQGDILTLP